MIKLLKRIISVLTIIKSTDNELVEFRHEVRCPCHFEFWKNLRVFISERWNLVPAYKRKENKDRSLYEHNVTFNSYMLSKYMKTCTKLCIIKPETDNNYALVIYDYYDADFLS